MIWPAEVLKVVLKCLEETSCSPPGQHPYREARWRQHHAVEVFFTSPDRWQRCTETSWMKTCSLRLERRFISQDNEPKHRPEEDQPGVKPDPAARGASEDGAEAGNTHVHGSSYVRIWKEVVENMKHFFHCKKVKNIRLCSRLQGPMGLPR